MGSFLRKLSRALPAVLAALPVVVEAIRQVREAARAPQTRDTVRP
ncbi:MAG TPA: hypothetical protein VEA61_15930 [Allosphingosinicella sp.]|nr:hypothetical protein [Allosphingosinicella sp.]